MEEFKLCPICQVTYDNLSDQMYLEIKHLGGDCDYREEVQLSYLAERDQIIDECKQNHHEGN